MLEGKKQTAQLKSNTKSIQALERLFWDPESNDNEKIGMRLMIHLA
jgi:hypothetical protein